MTAARILGATRPGSQQPSCIVRLWLCGLRGAWPPCLGPRHCGPPPNAPREAELHLLAGPCRNQCTRMRTLAGGLPPRPRRRRGGAEMTEKSLHHQKPAPSVLTAHRRKPGQHSTTCRKLNSKVNNYSLHRGGSSPEWSSENKE
ncbi:hypothetical protein LEMLEM_LOCUS13263 [Lemmus lemmus]